MRDYRIDFLFFLCIVVTFGLCTTGPRYEGVEFLQFTLVITLCDKDFNKDHTSLRIILICS